MLIQRVPNIPPQIKIVGISSPYSRPATAYVTFKGPWVSVAGRVKSWWYLRGEMRVMACSSGDEIAGGEDMWVNGGVRAI